ncbi:MAG: hypothetical protein ABIP55_04550 [Tepidisphaeraceae bacterium]
MALLKTPFRTTRQSARGNRIDGNEVVSHYKWTLFFQTRRAENRRRMIETPEPEQREGPDVIIEWA